MVKACRYCGKEFQTNDENAFSCSNCQVIFKEREQDFKDKNIRYIYCKFCGNPFHPLGTSTMCNGINEDKTHYQTCKVCGKGFVIKNSQIVTNKTICSKECRSKVMKIAYKHTKLNEKICEYCGKKFIPRSAHQKYCDGPHYKTCVICGNQFEVVFGINGIPLEDTRDTCSEECRLKKIALTSQDKYGETSIFKTEKFKEANKQMLIDKYGVDHYSKTQEYKDKYKKTMIARYGVSIPLQNDEIKKKFIQTNQERYGGNSALSDPLIIEKVKQTNFRKYGYEWPNQDPKRSNIIRQKEVLNHSKSIEDLSSREEYLKFKSDPASYLKLHNQEFDTYTLMKHLGYSDLTTINDIIKKNNLREYIISHTYHMEDEVVAFLKTLDLNMNIARNDRKEIAPKELDLYIPDYNFAIECNLTVTHNSTITLDGLIENKNLSMSPSYHQIKSKMCFEKGIFLFHIFGYEWKYKKDIIKSMIANDLGFSKNKYYARKLSIRQISKAECDEFLNENHKQGTMNSSVRLGLITSDDKLVSVMTFNKIRKGIGNLNSDTDNTWELSRFCNLKYSSVVGGASKLFKYFITHYQYDKIVSFSDVAHTKGSLYSILGFSCINQSSPEYTWVNLNTDYYLNRMSTQKSNLRNLFNDLTIDIENKTEQQIMYEHGFVQVFDCGTKRWEYTNPNL